ncbi:MAG: hypothetical protein JOY77_07800 [Alphaproteobacteria bacterium]|nr:hypothetical protein [Alphaproteobacteria bacterium]
MPKEASSTLQSNRWPLLPLMAMVSLCWVVAVVNPGKAQVLSAAAMTVVAACAFWETIARRVILEPDMLRFRDAWFREHAIPYERVTKCSFEKWQGMVIYVDAKVAVSWRPRDGNVERFAAEVERRRRLVHGKSRRSHAG